jgi:outer membrane receptor for ferrienterochelin and colicin
LQTDFLTLELFGNYVLNYVDIVVKKKEMKNAMTYDNVNAIIAGANLKFNYKWLTTELSYLWGENEDNKKPLAEIVPLSISSKVEIPIVENLSVLLTHRWENAQKRVNPDLKEFSTPAWNTLGLGLLYSFSWIHFDLQIQNLLNHNYYRFLSFSRNPFSAGLPVYEPGRVFMLTVYFNKN